MITTGPYFFSMVAAVRLLHVSLFRRSAAALHVCQDNVEKVNLRVYDARMVMLKWPSAPGHHELYSSIRTSCV